MDLSRLFKIIVKGLGETDSRGRTFYIIPQISIDTAVLAVNRECTVVLLITVEGINTTTLVTILCTINYSTVIEVGGVVVDSVNADKPAQLTLVIVTKFAAIISFIAAIAVIINVVSVTATIVIVAPVAHVKLESCGIEYV